MFYFSLWFLTSSHVKPLFQLCWSVIVLWIYEYSAIPTLALTYMVSFIILFNWTPLFSKHNTKSTRVTVVNKILCLRLKLLIWRGVSWWLRVLELDGCGFKYFLCHLIALWHCTCYLTSLHLSFFISKKEILNISTLQHFYIKFLY